MSFPLKATCGREKKTTAHLGDKSTEWTESLSSRVAQSAGVLHHTEVGHTWLAQQYISQMLHGAGIFTNIYPENHPVL